VGQMLRFILFQLRSTDDAHDGLYHQTQTQLRNFSLGIAISWRFIKLLRAWVRKVDHAHRRTLPYLVIILVHVTIVALAGLFSSRLVSQPDAILVNPVKCGWMAEPSPSISQDLSDPKQLDHFVTLLSTIRQSTKQSAEYARLCYAQNPSLSSSCQTYILSLALNQR
jgi:hypothetical protein